MFDAASYHATETLNDGRKVEIRAQQPRDQKGLRAAVRRASTETLYHRFFAVKREFSEQDAHFFLDIDFVRHVVLVAVMNEDGQPAIIGGCRYVVTRAGRAEVAFSVIDDYQRKGLGTALMRHLVAIGRAAGLSELVADVLADNTPMLKVFKRSGLAMTESRHGSVIHVVLSCAPNVARSLRA
jgi:RimJ/RimL family protein N-acetyltransferase